MKFSEFTQSEPRKEVMEAKAEYHDSGEFTDELYDVLDNVRKAVAVMKTPRWKEWMKVTDTNYHTRCVTLNKSSTDGIVHALELLEKLSTELESAE